MNQYLSVLSIVQLYESVGEIAVGQFCWCLSLGRTYRRNVRERLTSREQGSRDEGATRVRSPTDQCKHGTWRMAWRHPARVLLADMGKDMQLLRTVRT